MEVLSSLVLLHPADFERSFRFYAENLGLHVYREWGRGSTKGVVFFLERVMNPIRNGLGMRKTEIAREPN